jgi:hypothetical protein
MSLLCKTILLDFVQRLNYKITMFRKLYSYLDPGLRLAQPTGLTDTFTLFPPPPPHPFPYNETRIRLSKGGDFTVYTMDKTKK